MSKASWPLQVAVFDALAASSEVKALIGDPPRLYDDVPQGAAFPYVTLGQSLARNSGTATEDGAEHELVLHAWSRYGGHKEAKLIVAAIEAALHDAALAPAGHVLVNLRFAGSEFLRDADGETYHGIARFRAVTEPQ